MSRGKASTEVKNYYLRLPSELHEALVNRAIENRRSLAQEIIFLLEAGIKRPSN